ALRILFYPKCCTSLLNWGLKKDDGYFRLKEISTDSTIRIQTSDLFMSKIFWNYFTRHVKE
ncbi:MAG: hypothetical protein AABY78_07320, partial [Nitrospirota bacterium]